MSLKLCLDTSRLLGYTGILGDAVVVVAVLVVTAHCFTSAHIFGSVTRCFKCRDELGIDVVTGGLSRRVNKQTFARCYLPCRI